MSAYYNEWEPYPAQWLRNLAAANRITPGLVDERSIADVQPADLDGFTRAHFFAGIGGWEEALRLAEWPAEAPVWTGSCPCQPFSAAGKRGGADDERHLWPAFHRLIAERRPPVVFGEQVASADGRAWLSTVRADLEALGYAVGAADLCAAGAGAPHIRQRLWWGAVRLDDAAGGGRQQLADGRGGDAAGVQQAEPWIAVGGGCVDNAAPDRVDNSPGARHERAQRGHGERVAYSRQGISDEGSSRAGDASLQTERELSAGDDQRRGADYFNPWADPEWLPCSDGKARPTQPGLFPLAHGVPGRVGKLRAAGNAIVPQVAAAFVKAFMESANR